MLRNALQALQTIDIECQIATPSMSPIRLVDALIGPSAMTHLHGVSPKATRGALALVEDFARRKGPRIVNDVKSETDSLTTPCFPLSDAVTIFVHNSHVAVHIQRSPSERTNSSNHHVVILRDLAYSSGKIHLSPLSESITRGQSEAYCNCSAFAFHSSAEPFCKHIVVAAIAVTLQLAPIKSIAEDEFLQKIGDVS